MIKDVIKSKLNSLGSWLLSFYQVRKEVIKEKVKKLKQVLGKITIGLNASFVIVIAVVLLVMGINFFMLDFFYYKKSFNSAATNLLESTGYLAKSKLVHYLQPFYNSASLSVSLMQTDFLNTDNRDQFSKYLQNILQANPEFISVYFGDSKGNLFLMTRGTEEGTYAMVYAMKTGEVMKITEELFNKKGIKITSREIIAQQPDPRTRPWYIQASRDKRVTWSNAYHFQQYTSYLLPMLGMTACAPVYNSAGQLRGVFSIDLSLDQLTRSVETVKFLSGTTSFLVGNKEGVNVKKLLYPVAPTKTISYSFEDRIKNEVHIDDLNSPVAELSYSVFQKNKLNKFSYKNGVEEYFAYYVPLSDVFGQSWYIAVVTPAKSANIYFRRHIVMVGFIFLVAMCSIFAAVCFLSKRFTIVISRILQYASTIEALDFSQKISLTSKIVEINQLEKVVNLMGSVLKSFSRYVPTYLVRDVIASGDVSHIEGESKEISILFADIAGFSPLAEMMKPRDLMLYLSEYFNRMTGVVYSKGGTLDKYIGDAIMCFWGAPFEDKRHELHSCQCAVMLFENLKDLNKQWKLRGLPQLKIRVAVNSGMSIVGNVGSNDRLNYTTLGDSVNLASRLEGLNKIYGTNILIGENTYEAIKGQFPCRLVDRVAARGHTKGAYIYEIMIRDTEGLSFSPDEFPEYNKEFLSAFKFYEVGDWERARSIFSELLRKYPKDALSALYVKRCGSLGTKEAWDGIWKF